DELGPVVELEEVLERLPALRVHGDEVDELPVVLRREADALGVRDAPHRCRVDGAAEMDVELGELVSEGVRRARSPALGLWVAGARGDGGAAARACPRGGCARWRGRRRRR